MAKLFSRLMALISLSNFPLMQDFPFANIRKTWRATVHGVTKSWMLSRFSSVWLCVTPETAAHQASLSMGFSRQEHWSGLPFPSPMHESEKWKWSRSVVSDSSQPHGLQPTRLLRPWDFPGKITGVGCHCLLPDSNSLSVPLTVEVAWPFHIPAKATLLQRSL